VFEKVSGELKQTIILPRSGVYCIEFDNSYSWVNGKNIDYERIILAPLSYTSQQAFPFAHNYYLATPMAAVAKQYQVSIDCTPNPLVHVRRTEGIFSFAVEQNGRESYEYETDNSLRLLEKLNELASSGSTYHFCINRQRVKGM
jgi:hypothetical protein